MSLAASRRGSVQHWQACEGGQASELTVSRASSASIAIRLRLPTPSGCDVSLVAAAAAVAARPAAEGRGQHATAAI